MLQIKKVDAVKHTVSLRYPEDGSVLSGSLDCHFRFFPADELQAYIDQLMAGELKAFDLFRKQVVRIDGFPGEDGHPLTGDAVFEALRAHELGSIIQAAISAEYNAQVLEAKAKNSKRPRGF